MIEEAKYYESIDILAKAYIKGELNADDPCACAVGNLIAGRKNYKLTPRENTNDKAPFFSWYNPVFERQQWPVWHLDHIFKVESGYTIEQTTQIEIVFMGASIAQTSHSIEYAERLDELNFRGLMAVVEYLGKIHEADEKTIEESKLKFIKEEL